MPDTNKIPSWDETTEVSDSQTKIPTWDETVDIEKKNKNLPTGSKVGGQSQIPDQVSQLFSNAPPKSPFEQAALGQPPIDEAITPPVVSPRITSKQINPAYEKQGVGEENWKALKSAGLRAGGGIIGIPALINSTIFEFIQRPIMKAIGRTDEEVEQERQATKNIQVGGMPIGLTEIGVQQINIAATKIESTMKQYEGGIIESIDNGNYADAGRQIIKGVTQSLPYLAMVGATSGGGTPAVLTTLGTASASQRKGELEEQGIMEDEPAKQTFNSWLYGGFEAGGELFTAGIFNNLRRVLKGAPEDVIKKTAQEVAGQFIKEFTGESVSEGGTELGQQLTDYFMGQRESIDLKQVGDAMIIGGFAVGPIAGTTSVVDYIKGSRIAPPEDIQKVQENQEKIVDLKDKLNDTGNTVIKETIQEEISTAEKENNDIAEKNAATASQLNRDQFSSLSDIMTALDENNAVLLGKKDKKEDVKIEEEIKSQLEKKRDEIIKATETKKKAEKKEPEKPEFEKRYEESISQKSEEALAKMPTFKGKKFSLATILPNGDISNVYVRNEGESHKTYMSPEDAEAYESGRMTVGFWNGEKFVEAPQKGNEFGGKVMDIAASKIEIPKITEEPTNAERIRENAGSVQEGGNVGQEGQRKSGQNLQFQQEAGEITGDQKKGLTYPEMETQLDEINTSINTMKEENPTEFKKDGSPKAKSKLLGSYKALNNVRSGLIGNMQVQYEDEFASRAKEESEKSRIETEQINKAFEERQDELKKNISTEELKEIEVANEVQRIFDKVSNEEVPTEEEITFMNDNAYLPKGFEFREKGLQKVSEPEMVKVNTEPVPNIEPEVSQKLKAIAGKIREGKISRIQGFKTNTPFGLAWDAGLEVLATTLETTADLTTAISKALEHIKNTEWYKTLTQPKKDEFDSKFISHIENELGSEYRDATKHKFVNKEIEERFEQAVLHEKTFLDKAKEVFSDLRTKILRTYRHLPKNKQFAEAYNAINTFQKAVGIASNKAGTTVRSILGKMSKPEYDLFTKKVIFDDLWETIKLNPDYELPYGLTKETLRAELDNINKFVAYNGKVKEALSQRKEAYKEIQEDYKEWAKKIGINTEGFFDRNDYFRHQVLLYAEASKKGMIERKGSPLERPKKLSLFKMRAQGRGYDINRNYIEAEFEVFNKLSYAIEKMKMIENIYRNYDIMNDLRKAGKEELGEGATKADIEEWVKDNIPEGYVIDSPENMNIFMAQSIPEQLANDLLMGNVEQVGITKDDLRKIFALGAPKKIVIPIEIYRAIDDISQVSGTDKWSQFTKKTLTGWKIWTLISPKRFIKYWLRNTTGDSEAAFIGNPRVFKNAWDSTKELFDVYFLKKEPSPLMNEYISRGGLQLVLTTQEIGDLKKIKEFEKFFGSKRGVFSKVWDGYWNKVKTATDFREQILRYAAFKTWVSEIEKNKGEVKNYGASKPEFIDGLSNKYDKAFRLSNDLLGAYDQISEMGQNLRAYWIPFWSFQEVNFRRTNQIFMNTFHDKSLEGKALKGLELAARKTPFVALKAAKLTLKMAGFWAMTAVWNSLFFGDEEDELPEEIKSKPHVIFGRNSDGSVRYLSRLGVMGDYLEWFGMDAFPMYINEYLGGRMTPKEIIGDMLKSPANKIVNGVNPYIKTTGELIFKKSLFPDMFKPRVIRNYGEQIAINLGLKDEYRAISPLPDMAYYKSLRKMFWEEMDPLASAYWNIVSNKYKFKEKKGNASSGSFAVSDRSLALYYYKQALTYGDASSAEHYLEKYIMLGGTKRGYNSSMSYLNPLRGIKDSEMDEFKKYLGEKNEKQLEQAMKYYDKILNLKMDWPNDKQEDANPELELESE